MASAASGVSKVPARWENFLRTMWESNTVRGATLTRPFEGMTPERLLVGEVKPHLARRVQGNFFEGGADTRDVERLKVFLGLGSDRIRIFVTESLLKRFPQEALDQLGKPRDTGMWSLTLHNGDSVFVFDPDSEFTCFIKFYGPSDKNPSEMVRRLNLSVTVSDAIDRASGKRPAGHLHLSEPYAAYLPSYGYLIRTTGRIEELFAQGKDVHFLTALLGYPQGYFSADWVTDSTDNTSNWGVLGLFLGGLDIDSLAGILEHAQDYFLRRINDREAHFVHLKKLAAEIQRESDLAFLLAW